MFDLRSHNGTITVQSLKTGEHRTFKVSTVRHGALEGKRIVSMLVGADNENDYQGFGFVDDRGISVWQRKRTSFFETVANMLAFPDNWQDKARFLFEGRCRRCNRKLTHPESIDSGIGPECAKMS